MQHSGATAVYMPTTMDLESGFEVGAQGSRERQKASRSWAWKFCTALTLVALCAVTALLFTWHLQKRDHRNSERLGKFEANRNEEYGHQNALKQISGDAKAAIHLEGEVNAALYSKSVEWSDDVGHSFSQGGLSLKGNKIIIPRSGLYYVYSQASFRVACSASVEDEWYQQPLSHTVKRFSQSFNTDKPLLDSVRSACSSVSEDLGSGQRWYNTFYQGGVFRLLEGDQLWTETNRLSDLDPEDGKMFFGVFAL